MNALRTQAAAGRVFFGLALVAFGVQQFIYGDFIPGRAPAWPEGLLSRLSGTLSGLMILTWVVALHLPRALAAVSAADRRNEWTAVFEALAFAGVALFLGATLREERAAPRSLSEE